MGMTDDQVASFLDSAFGPQEPSPEEKFKDLSQAQILDYLSGKPLAKSGPGIIGDLGSKLVSGTGTGISSLGWLTGMKGVEDYGAEMAQNAEMQMSPVGIERSQREIFPTAAPGEGIMGLGFNPAGLAKVPYAIAESTPAMLAGIGAAVGATAVLPETAIVGVGSLALRALGPLAGRVAASSLGEAGVATAARSGIGLTEAAAPLIGQRVVQTMAASGVEGTQSGAMTGQQVEQQAIAHLTANPGDLEKSELGRASLQETNGNVEEAIKLTAARMGMEAFYKITPTTALLSLPGGYLETRLTSRVGGKGLLTETGIGALGEAAQEGPQSAAEEYLRGSIMSQADPSQAPTFQGVARAGLEGAIIGAGMGSGLGAAASAISPAERTAADAERQAQQELFERLQTFVVGRNLYEPEFSEAPIIETRGGDQISIPTLLAYADTIKDTSDPIYAINRQTADPGERAALLAEIMHPDQIQEAKKMGEQAQAAQEAAARQAEADRSDAEWQQTQQRLREIDEENATKQAAGQEDLLAGVAATRPTSAPEGSTEELMGTARDFRQNLGPTSYAEEPDAYTELADAIIAEQPSGERFSTLVLQDRIKEMAGVDLTVKEAQSLLDQYSTNVEDPSISTDSRPLYKDPEGNYFKRAGVPGTQGPEGRPAFADQGPIEPSGPEYARRRRRRRQAAPVDMSDVVPEIAAEPTPPAVSEDEYNNVRLSLNDEIARIAASGRGGERAANAVRRALRNKNFNAPQLLAAINIAKDQARILGGISSARPITQFVENLTDDSGAGAQGVRYGRTKNSVAGLIQYSLAPDQITFSNQTGVHEALHVVQSLLKAYDPNTYKIVEKDFTGENGRGISVSQIPKDIQRKLKLLTPEKGGKVSYWDLLNAEFGANATEGNQNAFSEHPDESMAYTFALLDDARRRGYKMGGLKPAYLRLLNLFSQIQQSVRRMLGGARTADEILSRISGGTLTAPGVPGRKFGAELPRRSSRRNAEFSSRESSIEPSLKADSAERRAWESKGVVNGNDGKPLMVYTGTTSDDIFDTFNVSGSGVWFVEDPRQASEYAEVYRSVYNGNAYRPKEGERGPGESGFVNDTPRVIPANIRMKNPLILSGNEWDEVVREYDSYETFDKALAVPHIRARLDKWNEMTGRDWRDWEAGGPVRRAGQEYVFDRFRSEGYDGIQIPEEGLYVIIGEPNQIKSPFNTFPEGAAEDKRFSKRFSKKSTNQDVVDYYVDHTPFGTSFKYKDFWHKNKNLSITKPEFKALMEKHVKKGTVSLESGGVYTMLWPSDLNQYVPSPPAGSAVASKKPPTTSGYTANDVVDVINKSYSEGDNIDIDDLAVAMNINKSDLEDIMLTIYADGTVPLYVTDFGADAFYTYSTNSDYNVVYKLLSTKKVGGTIDFNDFFWNTPGNPTGDYFYAIVENYVDDGFLKPLPNNQYEVVWAPGSAVKAVPKAVSQVHPKNVKGVGTLASALPQEFNNLDPIDLHTVAKISGLSFDEAKLALDALYAEGYPMLMGNGHQAKIGAPQYYFTSYPEDADHTVMGDIIGGMLAGDAMGYATFYNQAKGMPSQSQFQTLADSFVDDGVLKKNPDGTYVLATPNATPNATASSLSNADVEKAVVDNNIGGYTIYPDELAAKLGVSEGEAVAALDKLYKEGSPILASNSGDYIYTSHKDDSDYHRMAQYIAEMKSGEKMGYSDFNLQAHANITPGAFHKLADLFVDNGMLIDNGDDTYSAKYPKTFPAFGKGPNEPTDQQINDVRHRIYNYGFYGAKIDLHSLYKAMKPMGISPTLVDKALNSIYLEPDSLLAADGDSYARLFTYYSDISIFNGFLDDPNMSTISYSEFASKAKKSPKKKHFFAIGNHYVDLGKLKYVSNSAGGYYEKPVTTLENSALDFLGTGKVVELKNEEQAMLYGLIDQKVQSEPDDMSMDISDLYQKWFKGVNDTENLNKALSHAFNNGLLYNKKDGQIVKGRYPDNPTVNIETPYEPLPPQKPLTDAEIAELQKIAPNISKVGFRWLEQGLRDVREFAEWFADSDKVDAEGKPIPWYRGTRSANSPFMNTRGKYGGEDAYFASPEPAFASSWAGQGERSRMQPVFLKAANTFDYQNPDHLKMLAAHPDFKGDIQSIKRGNWPEIEQWPFLYRKMGFDSYYMFEAGSKNIAVFERQQMKSIFNQFKPGAGKEEAYSKRKALQLPAGMSEKDYQYGRMADTTTDAFLNFFKNSAVSDRYPRAIIRSANGERKQITAPAPKVVYHSGSFDETMGMIPMEGKGDFPTDGMHFGSRASAEERNLGKLVEDMAALVTAYKEGGLWHWTDEQGTTSQDFGETGWKTKDAAIQSGRTFVIREFADNYDPMNFMDFANTQPMTAVYLSIQNPKRVRDQGHDWSEEIRKAKAEGYDGIVYTNLFEDIGSESYIAFRPEQIKSIYNVGSFDPTVKDIRFSKRGAKKPKGLSDEDYVYGRMADVTTKAFQNFFDGSEVVSGDFITVTRMVNGKKVTDVMPAPLVVYHNGTYDERTGAIPMKGKGPFPKTGMHFGTKASAEDRTPLDYGDKKHKEEVGMKVASVYAEQYQLPNGEFAWENNADVLTEQPNLTPKQREGFKGFKTEEEAVEAGKKYVERYYSKGKYAQTAVYLSIKNAKKVTDQGLDWEPEIKKAKEEGYDGIWYYNQYEDRGSVSWIAFYPNQIKSIYNVGTFDPNVEDIRRSSRQRATAALEAAYVPGRIAETNTDSFKRWFKKSVVRNPDIAVMGIDPKSGMRTKTYRINPEPMYHAGSFLRAKNIPMEDDFSGSYPTDHMHFGTKKAALDRVSAMSEADVERKGNQVTEAYLSIQNPKLVNDVGGDPKKWSSLVQQAKAEGYDGLVYINKHEDVGSKSYVIFKDSQAKSTDNIGTFSDMLGDMRFSSRQADSKAASRAILKAWEAEKEAALAAGKKPPKRPWGNEQYGTGVWADPPNLGPRPRGRKMPGTPWGGRSGMSGKFSARQGSIEPRDDWSPQGAQLARRTTAIAHQISQQQGASFFQRTKNAAAKVFHPLGAMNKQDEMHDYLTRRYLALGKIDLAEENATKTYEALRKLPQNETKLVFEYLTTKGAVAPTLSVPGAREAAISAKQTISDYGDRLVRARILSPQAVAEYKGSYLPRMYMKYLLEEKGMISSGIKMDLAYVNKRQNLSAEERLALGEVKDPGFLAFMAMYRPARDLAVMDFLRNILSVSQDKGYDWFLPDNLVDWRGTTVTSHWLASEANAIDERADYFVNDPNKKRAMNDLATEMRRAAAPGMRARVPEDYKMVPDTSRYGALRGVIARKEVYDDIVGTGGFINADNWWDKTFGDTGSTLTKATAIWKMTKTTMNPPTQVRNFVSNAVVLNLSGVNMLKIPFLLMQAAKEISNNGPNFRIAQKYGIRASGFNQIELREANQIMQDMLSRSEGGALNVPHMVKSFGAWVTKKAGDLYAYSEVLFKTAKLIDELSKGKSESAAALEAHDWFFDYSLVHPSIRRIRNVPFGMPFITYYYKILPKLAETLIKHPMRFAKYAAIAFVLPMVFADQNDVDEDDFEKLRNSLGERIRNKSNLWVIPDKDQNGNWNFVDVGYALPWSMFQDVGMALGRGDVAGATQTVGILGSPALSVAAAMKTNVDPFTGRKIWDETQPPKERAKSLLGYIFSIIAPPFLTGTGFTGKLIDKVVGTGLDKYGEPVDTNLQLAGRLLGFNTYALNPQMQRMRNVSFMQKEIRDIEIKRAYTARDMSLSPEARQERIDEFNDYLNQKMEELQQYISDSEIPESLSAGKE